MRRSVVLFCILLAAGTASAYAQAVPAATARHVSITAGGMASLFQPSFQGDWQAETVPPTYCYPTSVCAPVSAASPFGLFGVGAYVDVKFTRWIQIEAEGRWLRFNQYQNIHQDNYLIGPRVPIHRFWKAEVYGKALIGYGSMDLGVYPGLCTGQCEATGRFTAVAFGGGADIRLNRRFSLRAFDAEYQYWPTWGNSSLSPYGVSMGIGYKVF
jgi:hypothetical protein